jgi:hypothetical protein
MWAQPLSSDTDDPKSFVGRLTVKNNDDSQVRDPDFLDGPLYPSC